MDYRAAAAEVRSARDRQLEQVAADARRRLAELAAEKDAEIHRLRAEGLSAEQIGAAIGYSGAMVRELLNPDRRAAYNARRRAHWKVYHGGRAA